MSKIKLTKGGKIFAAIAIFALIIVGFKEIPKLLPEKIKETFAPSVDNLPPLKYDATANAPETPLPSTNSATISSPLVKIEVMGWNAQTGLMFANGGENTTEGSFMQKQNINFQIICQNDCNEQLKDLMTFAQECKNGNMNSSKGCQMIALMGDGGPAYISGLNAQIKKTLGDDYIAQVFFSAGSSFGEDKFMARPEFKQHPQGPFIVGVLKDGDWNIAMKWCGDNNVPVNNDPKTYDPNAVNWRNAKDYIEAAQQYIQQTAEKRAIVINGKKTGRDTTVVPNGVVTWTPGDVNVVKQKGGVITIASTKVYSAQMPCCFIGIKKWLQANRKTVDGIILATSMGGDQVKSHSKALTFASKVSAAVYKDETMKAEDWEKYYKGFQMTDPEGHIIELGGSRVWNLADNADYFGLTGGVDKYAAVYKTFGDLDVKCYPEDIPSYPPFDEVVDLSYLREVYAQNKSNPNMAGASTPKFVEGETMSTVISSRSVTVEFETGSTRISSKGMNDIKQLASDLIIAGNSLVNIEGYTDNVGNDQSNIILSQGRADAIKNALLSYDRNAFTNRITAIGHGKENPIASNSTDAGRQKNRRVEIKIGQ